MYLRITKSRGRRWGSTCQSLEYFIRSKIDTTCSRSLSWEPVLKEHSSQKSIIKRHWLDSFSAQTIASRSYYLRFLARPSLCWINTQFCAYSSEGDGRNASEKKHMPETRGTDFDKQKERREKVGRNSKHIDSHSQLGEHDQKEWLNKEKLAIESRRRESPFLTRRDKFKNEFLRRIVQWEEINIAWDTFPYYIHEHDKNLLKECAASHLKNKKLCMSYGAHLSSSSGRILLQSVPGTELYRERLVKALACELKVPLLVLDGSTLAAYDFNNGMLSENESDDENDESEDDDSMESEEDMDHDASNEEEWNSTSDVKSECSDNDEVDVEKAAEVALKKLVPYNLEDLAKEVPVESESDSSKSENSEHSDKCKRSLKKGDRVRYVGPSVCVEADNRVILGKILTSDGPRNAYTIIRGRALSNGQCGEIYEVNGDRAAVILDVCNKEGGEGEEKKVSEENPKPPVYWIHVKDIEHDQDTKTEDYYIAIAALGEVLHSKQPLIVYFPDSSQWLSRAVRKSNRKDFVNKVQEMFDQLSGPVVLICGQNRAESGSKEKAKFTMILPNVGRLAKLPFPLNRLTEGLQVTKRSDVDDEIFRLFDNVLSLHPPKEVDVLRNFNKQVEEDRKFFTSRSNLNELHRVLEEHRLSCIDLLHIDTYGVVLSKRKAEKVVGWAKNHYLSSCLVPSIRNEKLCLPRESLEIAILRLKEQEDVSKKSSQSLKDLAKDEYETNFISAVLPPGEIGVRFDDVGALEDVKKALNELVILPMKRPELFSRGNLLQPCKGILLFGPPGTGKTLLAKALATEAGASFMSITGSNLTSKWFGDAEKLTKALFSFASKLAPVIIFVDEVDSLLGARGGGFEHEATRRMRNEFMAAWDGLRSKESERILILGATNRPFDLDDAVIRRLPRRIYVDLPDSENRLKILRIILEKEHLEPGLEFEKLASLTEGYSGSDLKNLCIAAAYRPVQELIEEEKKGIEGDGTPVLRPLNLDDFVQSKSKVGPSVAYDAASMNELRKWNEQYGEGGSRRKSPFGFGN